MALNFCLVEDDELTSLNMEFFLKSHGKVSSFFNKSDALLSISTSKFDMAFLDLDLVGELDGLSLISPLLEKGTYVVILSGREEDSVIGKAYELGASDFISKPFKKKAFEFIIKKYKLKQSNAKLDHFFKEKFITNDSDLIDSLQILSEAVVTERPIYIKGGTGTGKTHIAKLIHELIFDNTENFIHLNCSEIPEGLLESELFGHKKGAFTGANTDKVGKLAMADGGTLFLDEIATMPMSTQKKILRVIEEKSFYPLGSKELERSNFRLISATCEDLEHMVSDNRFREDLYYRIEGYNIELKELRKRKRDIVELVNYFSKKSLRRVVITSEVFSIFKRYDWPGNVRELKKTIDMLCAKERGVITPDMLPDKFLLSSEVVQSKFDSETHDFISEYGVRKYLEKVEENLFEHYMELNENRVRDVMSQLKISSSSFYKIRDRIKLCKK